MIIGQLVRNFLTKLEWYSSLFPRIPVPIQKEIERKLNEHKSIVNYKAEEESNAYEEHPTYEDRSVEHGSPRYVSAVSTRSSSLLLNPPGPSFAVYWIFRASPFLIRLFRCIH